jgi:hypothetical protein
MGIMSDLFPATAFADFVKAPGPSVRAAIAELWQKQARGNAQIEEHAVLARDLTSSVSRLDPATSIPTGCIVLSTAKTGWVAVYYNAIEGMSLAGYLARRFTSEAAHFRLMADTVKRQGKTLVGRFGVIRLEYFRDGDQVRQIINVNDQGKWRFGHNGEQLPFENAENYKAPRVVDRFTPGMLLTYLAALGLRPYEDDFFLVSSRQPAEGLTLTWGPQRRNEAAPKSLTDVRREWGLTDGVINHLLQAQSRPSSPRKQRG